MEMTPAPIEKDNKILSSEYEMKLNGENFTVKLELYTATINFISQPKNSLSPLYYKRNFKLEEMKNLSKSFTLFDSIKAIYQCVKEILDEGKGEIFFEKDNFVVSIPLFLPTGKQELIYFYLNKNNLEKDEIIQNLCKRITELENKIKENEKIKNDLKITLDHITNEIIKYRSEIDKINFEKNELQNIRNEYAQVLGRKFQDIIKKQNNYYKILDKSLELYDNYNILENKEESK